MDDQKGKDINHYLDRYGCSFGQVNRARLEHLEEDMANINAKLWALIILLLTEMAGTIIYLVFVHHA